MYKPRVPQQRGTGSDRRQPVTRSSAYAGERALHCLRVRSRDRLGPPRSPCRESCWGTLSVAQCTVGPTLRTPLPSSPTLWCVNRRCGTKRTSEKDGARGGGSLRVYRRNAAGPSSGGAVWRSSGLGWKLLQLWLHRDTRFARTGRPPTVCELPEAEGVK